MVEHLPNTNEALGSRPGTENKNTHTNKSNHTQLGRGLRMNERGTGCTFVIKITAYLIYPLIITTWGILIMCMHACTDVYPGTRMVVTGHLPGVGSLHPPWVLRIKLRSLGLVCI